MHVNLANDIFSMIFLLEFIVKFAGLGLSHYFHDNWNKLDFFILVMQLISISLNYIPAVGFSDKQLWINSVINFLRVTKILRMVKYATYFRHIFNTLVISMPLIANIGSLLLLILYVYAVAGVLLFGRVKRNYFMRDNLNFESFEKGVFALFVISTTDWWSDYVISFMRKRSPDFDCEVNPSYE